MDSGDEGGGRGKRSVEGDTGEEGTDYVVVHEGQMVPMDGAHSRGDSKGSDFGSGLGGGLGGAPLSPTHRGGDITDPATQADIRQALEREQEKIIQRKKEAQDAAQKVRVADHPKYKEYVKFDKIGVGGKLLEKMMAAEGLHYDCLEDPEDLISWDGKENDSSDESSMGSLEELDMDDSPFPTPAGSRQQTPGAPKGGGYNTRAHGEALGSGAGEDAGVHGGGIKTPPISPKNQEVAEVFKAFVADDDESSDDSSDDESLLDPEEMQAQDDPNAKEDGPEHDFLIGDKLFKVERCVRRGGG